MNARTQKWLYGLGSAVIGGGASAVVNGLLSMGFAPDKFNLQNLSGVWHLLGLMVANFLVSGFLSAMFYLRQSPLPPEGDTGFVQKPIDNPPKT
jgi:hypothetical protein